MRLKKEVQNFSSSCERLMFEADVTNRKLTQEEKLLVEFYCREVLEKVVKSSPPQKSDSSASGQRSDIPPPDPSQRSTSLQCSV